MKYEGRQLVRGVVEYIRYGYETLFNMLQTMGGNDADVGRNDLCEDIFKQKLEVISQYK